MAIVRRHKKGSLSWFNSLTEDFQLELFRRWRMMTTDIRNSWCLSDIKKNEEVVKLMLGELSREFCSDKKTNYNFNNLDEPRRSRGLYL